jgi:hypothetical protein
MSLALRQVGRAVLSLCRHTWASVDNGCRNNYWNLNDWPERRKN